MTVVKNRMQMKVQYIKRKNWNTCMKNNILNIRSSVLTETNITLFLINWMYFSYFFPPQVRSSTLSVKCQLTVNLTNEHNQKSSYVLVSDSDCQIYVIHQGNVVMVIKTPSIITAVSFHFQVNTKNIYFSEAFIPQFTQILFACS